MQTNEIPLQFEHMVAADIPELTAIMTRAFDKDAQDFLGQPSGGPDGYNTGDFLRKWAFEAGGLGWKISADGKVAGAFIVFINPEGDYWLGNIFVDPAYQNLQIGTRTWEFIEATYPGANSWNLGTPTWAIRNHHFYEKLGFKRVKVEGDDVKYKKELAS
ncbi:MAG: GNAT family N-acetyltransferase [Chloroflexota bacterium]